MNGDIRWTCTAIPLTPIHVGDGGVMGPEEYKLDGGELVRFSSSAVLRDMAPAGRRLYMAALDRGDLHGAWRIIRDAVHPPHEIERMAVGADARGEIARLLQGESRKGDVRPMMRTGGRPMIPGSSLKGAIRTALLSALAPRHRSFIEQQMRAHRPPRTGPASDAVQQQMLGHGCTDQDPFRFVRVSDIVLPAGATRIDRVVNWRPARLIKDGNQPAEKMQMIYERVRACSDEAPSPTAEVELTLALGALHGSTRLDPAGAKTPRFALDAGEVWRSVNAFHWRLLEQETERFYREHPDIKQALDRAFRVRTPGGELDAAALRRRDDILLLRVGRFGQFESKSLDGFRAGWNAQAKPPRSMTVGNTRNLMRAATHAPLIPFGWLLLAPLGTEPAQARPVTATTAAPSTTAPPSAKRAPASLRATYQGEPVEVLTRRGGEACIRFANGDTEWVDESELDQS